MAVKGTELMAHGLKVVQVNGCWIWDVFAHPSVMFVLLLFVAVRAFAGSASLAWDPVNSAALAGYKVYSGPAAGSYTSSLDVGNTTMSTVANLTEGQTYHFAVTAYDSGHVESAFSNDVSATIPYGAPVAQFSASTTSGAAPLALNFTSTSTGSITGYAWTFGDGGTSTAQNPSHVYAAAGTYSVGLTVTGPGGSNTKTNANYIVVSAGGGTGTQPSALYSETFTGANANPIGGVWATITGLGNMQRLSNTLRGNAADSGAYVSTVTPQNDQYAKATLGSTTIIGDGGPILRAATGAVTHYLLDIASHVQIFYVSAGSYTPISSAIIYPGTPKVGDVWEFDVVG